MDTPLTEGQRVLLKDNLEWIYELVRRHIMAFPRHDTRGRSASGRRADLEQAGALAAVKVMPRYDPSMGAVTTFITRPVINAIREEDFRRQRGPVDLPRLGAGGVMGYARAPSFEEDVPEVPDVSEPVDLGELVSRIRAEVPPMIQTKQLTLEGATRAVDSLLLRLTEGVSDRADALRLGVNYSRVGQLRKVAHRGLENWAAQIRRGD